MNDLQKDDHYLIKKIFKALSLDRDMQKRIWEANSISKDLRDRINKTLK